MSIPTCTDVCEVLQEQLEKLHFVFSEDEDHTDILEALVEVHISTTPPITLDWLIASIDAFCRGRAFIEGEHGERSWSPQDSRALAHHILGNWEQIHQK